MAIRLHTLPAVQAMLPAHDGAREPCARCRQAALRLRELERANRCLSNEAELAALRVQALTERLAAAQGQGASLTPAGARHGSCAGAVVQHLGARELQVLRMITEGQRTPQIATRLGITAATVEVHRRNIMRKIGLHSVAQLTRYALREGIAQL